MTSAEVAESLSDLSHDFVDKFWVFTSSPQMEGTGDIIGLLLERKSER